MNEVLNYIRQCVPLGASEAEITAQLRQAGWDEPIISQAWAQMHEAAAVGANRAARLLRRLRVPAIILAGLIVLATGGYFAYAKLANNPDRIWLAATANLGKINSGHVAMTLNYLDQSQTQASSDASGLFGNISAVKLSLNTDGNFKPAGAGGYDLDLNSTASLGLGPLSFDLSFQTRSIANVVYFKLGSTSLDALLRQNGMTALENWSKIDLGAASAAAENLGALSKAQQKQIDGAMSKAHLISGTKFVGEETRNGEAMLHYTLTADKASFKQLVLDLAKISGVQTQSLDDLAALIEKIEVRKFEVWVGKNDHYFRSVDFETNFPSLLATSEAYSGSAMISSRDARRLADVRQIQTALELFYNNNRRYPSATAGGLPDLNDGNPKLSTYVPTLPHAPTPPDGSCSATDNYYKYTPKANGTSYTLDFCLGNDAGSLKAGIFEATPELGVISAGRPGSNPQPPPVSPLANIAPSASLNLQIDLSQINQPVNIETPQGAKDYTPFLQGQNVDIPLNSTTPFAQPSPAAPTSTSELNTANDSMALAQTCGGDLRCLVGGARTCHTTLTADATQLDPLNLLLRLARSELDLTQLGSGQCAFLDQTSETNTGTLHNTDLLTQVLQTFTAPGSQLPRLQQSATSLDDQLKTAAQTLYDFAPKLASVLVLFKP